MSLVDTDLAIRHLREAPDVDVSVYLAAAEEKALAFLGRSVYPDQATLDAAVTEGTAGEWPMLINASVKAAVLLILGHLWANREAVITGSSAAAVKIPLGAEDFLWPFRKGLGV